MILIKFISLLTFFQPSTSIWWWFSTDEDSEYDYKTSESIVDSSVSSVQMFAPFEITTMEEKFLNQAQHYLQNLPMLDQCNMLIINRLKTSCNKLSDEDLSKLSVNLLNCQSAVEGRKLFKCTEDMALAECTATMDSDVWNSYHIISNRARAICHSVRQTEFRMKTEQTVNNLATATLENVNMLKNLATGQKELQAATDDAIDAITTNQKDIMSKQDEFKQQQLVIGDVMVDNMNTMLQEKHIIAERHKQVEEYTQMINYQLAALVKEIKSQDQAKKETEEELLNDLNTVKSKADEVLQKLEVAFVDMDSYHENVESKQNKTLKNLEEIQETIAFMNNILTKLSTSINEQLPWLQDMFGGTMDKLTMITLILGHLIFFVGSFLAILFVNGPSVTRVALLIVIPLNCLAALQDTHSLTYHQLAWFLALTIPVTYLVKKLITIVSALWYKDTKDLVPMSTLSKTDVTRDLSSALSLEDVPALHTNSFHSPLAPKSDLIKHAHLNKNMSSTPERFVATSHPSFPSKLEMTPNSSSVTPPLKRRSMLNVSLGLDTTVGGSVKCTAKTKVGARCKNAALNCSLTCRIHTPQKR